MVAAIVDRDRPPDRSRSRVARVDMEVIADQVPTLDRSRSPVARVDMEVMEDLRAVPKLVRNPSPAVKAVMVDMVLMVL